MYCYQEIITKGSRDYTCDGDMRDGLEAESRRGGDQEEEGELCNVCLSEFENADVIRRLPCLHFSHTEGVDAWLRKNETCPTCRWSLVPREDEGAEDPPRPPGAVAVAGEDGPSSGEGRLRVWGCLLWIVSGRNGMGQTTAPPPHPSMA